MLAPVTTKPTHSSGDSKERFSSRVDAYVKARPRYPREVIDHLRDAIGLRPDWHVVDVGSGTGISCALFLANGNPVTGVEPNAPMRQAAEGSLAGFAPRFRSVDGSAEATTLPDNSADLVVAAQAFHWFDVEKTQGEFQRILRPGGYALLMWNNRRLDGTPFLEGYEQLLIEFGTDYLKVRHNNVADPQLRAFFGGDYQSATLPNAQHLDYAGVEARLLSSSYIPAAGDARHDMMLRALRRLFDDHNEAGRVTIEYQTELFYGHLRG
jgi:ubiquinone/menaquinone biosynthesis C-methylase UbiE